MLGEYELGDVTYESSTLTIHRGWSSNTSGEPVLVRIRNTENDAEASGLLRRYRANSAAVRCQMPVLGCGFVDRHIIYSVVPDIGYQTLHQLKTGSLSEHVLLRSMSRIARDLSRRKAHTNLKPGNILLHTDEPPRMADDDPLPPTGRYDVFRADNDLFQFAAPEVIAGEPEVRSSWNAEEQHNVFSLGCMLAWFLGGGLPEPHESWDLATNPALAATIDTMPRIPSGLSSELTTLLARCLAPDPAERLESLRDLSDELQAVAEACAHSDEQSEQPRWIATETDPRHDAPQGAVADPTIDGEEATNAEDTGPGDTTDQQRAVLESLLPTDYSARGIFQELNEFVIGQDRGKRELSVLVSMHLTWFHNEDPVHKAPNAILIGSTGVGKTHSLRTIARYLKLPYAIVDATSLVPSGIVGPQVEDVLADIVDMAGSILTAAGVKRFPDDDLDLARRGIIFIDEFDKLRKTGRRELDGDNEQVQRRLLKLIEGATLTVGQRRHVNQTEVRHMETSGILVIASGSFDGITAREIINERPNALQRTIMETETIISHDVKTYGFIPELVARLTILVRFDALDASSLLKILKASRLNPMIVWQNHFARLGKKLSATDEALEVVAAHAADLSLGARGIAQVLFPLLESVAYDFEASGEESYILEAEDVERGRRHSRRE